MRTLKELFDLRGRVALVTGGAGWLGRAACDVLAELGADLAVLDLDATSCLETVDRVTNTFGVRAVAVPTNLEVADSVRAVPRVVVDELGSLDIVVNCAALVGTSDSEGWAVPFESQSLETWRRALEVNLTAPFNLVQAAAPHLRASGRGAVVNVGSIYGLVGPDWSLYEGSGLGNPAAYAASKGGLLQLTRWLATTLAPDVRVNAVSPGGIFRGHTDPFLSRYTEKVPLGRMASEEDLLGAIALLSSDAGRYMTGTHLIVDGGLTAW